MNPLVSTESGKICQPKKENVGFMAGLGPAWSWLAQKLEWSPCLLDSTLPIAGQKARMSNKSSVLFGGQIMHMDMNFHDHESLGFHIC